MGRYFTYLHKPPLPSTHFTNPHHPVARVQKIIQADPERITTSKNAAFAIALATEMFIQHLATTTHNVVKAERKPRRNIQYRDVSSAIAKTDNLEFLVDVAPKTGTWGVVKKKLDEKDKEREEGRKKGDGKTGKGKTQMTLDGAGAGAVDTGEDGNGNGVEKVDEDTAVTALASASGSPPQPQQSEDKVGETPPPSRPENEDEMDVDQAIEQKQVEDSEPEEDAAAMQIEMEMRGPPRQPTKSASPKATRRSTGFTAINSSK